MGLRLRSLLAGVVPEPNKAFRLRSQILGLLDEVSLAISDPGANELSVARLKEGLNSCRSIDGYTTPEALGAVRSRLSAALAEARILRRERSGLAGPFSIGPAFLGAASAPVSRPSCLECVEKHLGASWVLITETRNGYPHRTMAVGHLHEAEDESQAFPDLHNAIRDARKRYQTDETMPDWPKLRKLLEAARKGS